MPTIGAVCPLSLLLLSWDHCLKMSQVGSYCVCLLSKSGLRNAREHTTHALTDGDHCCLITFYKCGVNSYP